MRKLHFFIICTATLTITSWAGITTRYTTGGCKSSWMAKSVAVASNPEDSLDKEVVFTGDTITMQGRIYANCCGTHLLNIDIVADVITIVRIDTGSLCACHCPFDFKVQIPGGERDTYRIHLENYFGDSLDTQVVRNAPTVINHAPKASFRNHDFRNAEKALFDIRGRRLGKSPIRTTPGIYLMKSVDNRRGTIKFIHD